MRQKVIVDPTRMKADVFQMSHNHWQALGKAGDKHKYDYGHCVVVSGPAEQGGAARLAALGALRIGAGLVSVACPNDARFEHAAQLNAIMVKSYADGFDFAQLLLQANPQAICIGPNLGVGHDSKVRLGQVLSHGGPICLDADAITLLSQGGVPDGVTVGSDCVMTPHEGELRRYVPRIFEETTSRIAQAQAGADKAGCTVLLKGPETVVASPTRRPVIVSSKALQHAGWLATAGSGDVLAGFIAGLLARGFGAFDAAVYGAELHFRCAAQFGPGLISEDIPEMLPHVLR